MQFKQYKLILWLRVTQIGFGTGIKLIVEGPPSFKDKEGNLLLCVIGVDCHRGTKSLLVLMILE